MKLVPISNHAGRKFISEIRDKSPCSVGSRHFFSRYRRVYLLSSARKALP